MAADYYELLRIKPDANADEIHKAYRSLAMCYHPDRNATPQAASRMAGINEAYSLLRDPTRRRSYDYKRNRERSSKVAGSILRAAYDTLLRQGWHVSKNDGVTVVFEQGKRSVCVKLLERMDNVSLRKIEKQFAGFSVVLAVEIETPINLAIHTVGVDLMHSRLYGTFPDQTYRALFAPLLR